MKNEPITAIYCRTDCKDDDAMLHQETMLRQYAAEHGYGNIKVYSDNGYVGLNYDRPAFSQLQADIESSIVGTVIVKDFTQITMRWNLPKWVWKPQGAGVKFISVADDYDNDAPTGKGFQNLLIAMHDESRRNKKICVGLYLRLGSIE